MVKTEKKELPKCLTELIIEVEDKVVQEATEITVAAMAKEAKIPGFRPGKAPKHIIEKNFGKAAIFQKALDDLLPKIYSESLIKESIEPIGQPEINIKSTEPLVIEAKIPTKPIINGKKKFKIPGKEFEKLILKKLLKITSKILIKIRPEPIYK